MLTNGPIVMTPEGFQRTEGELQDLENVRLPRIVEMVRAARELAGTLDPEYAEAREQLGWIQDRIAELHSVLAHAEVVERGAPDGVVGLGCRVVLLFEEEQEEMGFDIVGTAEADPLAGRISCQSPLGQSLEGRSAGDRIDWTTPDGVATQATVLRVE
jgi:transcription elongation factor GreA